MTISQCSCGQMVRSDEPHTCPQQVVTLPLAALPGENVRLQNEMDDLDEAHRRLQAELKEAQERIAWLEKGSCVCDMAGTCINCRLADERAKAQAELKEAREACTEREEDWLEMRAVLERIGKEFGIGELEKTELIEKSVVKGIAELRSVRDEFDRRMNQYAGEAELAEVVIKQASADLRYIEAEEDEKLYRAHVRGVKERMDRALLKDERQLPPADLEDPEEDHCDDQIFNFDLPICARAWLVLHRLPATDKMLLQGGGFRPELYADFEGKPVRVVMASRFGDVGITSALDRDHGYEKRVLVKHLTNFRDMP